MALVESVVFIVVAVAIIAFGSVSGRAERSVVTPPMAFVLLGVLAGPLALGLVDFDTETRWIHALAELTLVVPKTEVGCCPSTAGVFPFRVRRQAVLWSPLTLTQPFAEFDRIMPRYHLNRSSVVTFEFGRIVAHHSFVLSLRDRIDAQPEWLGNLRVHCRVGFQRDAYQSSW